MTLGMRIKKVRKDKDLTQQEFGKCIGIKPNSISLIESGGRNASEQVILSICREFNVSETWLRTGEGEMFVPRPGDTLDAFIRERDLSPSDRILIEKFAALSVGNRQAVVEYVLSAADEILKNLAAPVVVSKKETTTPAMDTAEQERTEVNIAAKVAELEEQNRELKAQNLELKAELAAYDDFGERAKKLAISHNISEEKQESSASSASGSGAG